MYQNRGDRVFQLVLGLETGNRIGKINSRAGLNGEGSKSERDPDLQGLDVDGNTQHLI